MTRNQQGFQPDPFGRANRAGGEPNDSGPNDDLFARPLPADEMAADDFGLDGFDPDEFEPPAIREESYAPSLPIILFSAASGVAGGVIALFISYRWLQWGIELSAGVSTLALLFGLGISGAVLSAAMGSRAAPVNILFSCGVILLAIFFMALCLLVGALVGTILVQL